MELQADTQQLFERVLDYRVYWSACQSSHCVNTDWRVLPFWVVLSITRGSYGCTLIRNGQQAYFRAGPGEVLLVPAGVRHALTVDEPTTADGLHVHYTLFQNIDVLSFYQVPPIVSQAQAGSMQQATSALAAITEHKQATSLTSLVEKNAQAYRFLHAVLAVSEAIPDKEKQLLSIRRIRSAITYIDEHLEQPIRVERLASLCSLSRNRFSDLFREVLGQPPKHYIDQKRLDKAMSLLVHSELSVAEIADRLGFCDQFHFSKRFKRAAGESPSEYRTHIRKTLFG